MTLGSVTTPRIVAQTGGKRKIEGRRQRNVPRGTLRRAVDPLSRCWARKDKSPQPPLSKGGPKSETKIPSGQSNPPFGKGGRGGIFSAGRCYQQNAGDRSSGKTVRHALELLRRLGRLLVRHPH